RGRLGGLWSPSGSAGDTAPPAVIASPGPAPEGSGVVTVQSPAPAPSAPSQPPGSVRAAPRRRRPARLAVATTPTLLRILMIILLLASLAWGAVGAWAVSKHASAAPDVVSTSEPLSLSAQQMYRSLS